MENTEYNAADEILTVDEIQDLLIEEMGETGSWRVSGDSGLYLKKEANYRDIYFGTVENEADVQTAYDSIVWE